MKLYQSVGPNPRAVKMFIAEKGMDVERVAVDLMGGENRREPYLKVNPAGQTPALELDDGSCVTEITAICEYLEEKQPEPALIGRTAEERAKTRMWLRRIDHKICEPMANGFRFGEGLQLFQNRLRCVPEASPGL
jgi:glutathione S-transferase